MIVRLAGLPAIDRGQRVLLQITAIDELALDMDCRFIESMDSQPPEDLIEAT
jgi:exoribonuclease-2